MVSLGSVMLVASFCTVVSIIFTLVAVSEKERELVGQVNAFQAQLRNLETRIWLDFSHWTGRMVHVDKILIELQDRMRQLAQEAKLSMPPDLRPVWNTCLESPNVASREKEGQ